MDYRLPTLNGIEATKKILEIDPETKIIFLSADVSVREEALQIGVFIFIAKPASLKEITDAIENIIKTCPNLKV
jgi:two-component system chemotaxis response regulator CheY